MIKVLIERIIVPGLEKNYVEIARDVFQKAVSAPGYIGGESWMDAERPNHRYIMTTWQSIDHWHQWANSPIRKEAASALASVLEQPEKIVLLNQG